MMIPDMTGIKRLTWKQALEGFIVAAIGGACMAVFAWYTTPQAHLNENPNALWNAASGGAFVGVAAWLRQTPMGKQILAVKQAENEALKASAARAGEVQSAQAEQASIPSIQQPPKPPAA